MNEVGHQIAPFRQQAPRAELLTSIVRAGGTGRSRGGKGSHASCDQSACVAVVLAVPTATAMAVVSSPAWALSASESCHSLTGKTRGPHTFLLKVCRAGTSGNRKIVGLGTDLTTVGSNLAYQWTWGPSYSETTDVLLNVVANGNFSCHLSWMKYTVTDVVTGGTGPPQAGEPVAIDVCFKPGAPSIDHLKSPLGVPETL